MKKVIFFCLILSSFRVFAQSEIKKPLLYTDKSKAPLADGKYVNCLTVNSLSCVFQLSDEMKNYDIYKLELHRYGDTCDIIAAEKIFTPNSKEYQKQYGKLDSAKLSILAEEGQFSGSDLEVNTMIFPKNSTTNMAFCKSHNLSYCSWYIIVKGYKKTGEKTRFDEDIFDKGTNLSEKSVVFKSWESKAK